MAGTIAATIVVAHEVRITVCSRDVDAAIPAIAGVFGSDVAAVVFDVSCACETSVAPENTGECSVRVYFPVATVVAVEVVVAVLVTLPPVIGIEW